MHTNHPVHRIAHAQRSSDIPVAVTQELSKLRIDHADLLGHYQSQSNALAQKDQELKQSEQSLTRAQNEANDLRLRLQFAEATIVRTEKRAKTAQQEVELLNSLLVGILARLSRSILTSRSCRKISPIKRRQQKTRVQEIEHTTTLQNERACV